MSGWVGPYQAGSPGWARYRVRGAEGPAGAVALLRENYERMGTKRPETERSDEA